MHNPQLLLFSLLISFCCFAPLYSSDATVAKVDVGVILDLDTTLGKICRTSISMAIEDFYANGDHSTMIVPHFRDSRSDVVAAASAAIDLLKNTQVMAILGPQSSVQADFVIDIGDKVKVPILSPATSLTLSPQESPYFIRSAWSSSSQIKAIAAIVKNFSWREVVFIYEDKNYGSGLVPFLSEELLESNALVSYQTAISSIATDDQIRLELGKLLNLQTRVFAVRMLPALASRFFKLAKEAGMMDNGYAWIISDELTSLLDCLDSKTMEAMQGVLGVKAYVQESDELEKFEKRWSKRFHKENPDMDRTKLNVFGLWAYDSIAALAGGVERVGVASPKFNRVHGRGNMIDLEAIGISNTGSLLVSFIKNFTSKGLSGDFNISNGQLQPSSFEIINVNGKKEFTVGFWTEQCGLVKPEDHPFECSRTEENLDLIIWPGKTCEVPKGWKFPKNGKKLRVGVPTKGGFNEFIKVEMNEETGAVNATGFSIDVFKEVWFKRPHAVPIEYVAFNSRSRWSEGGYDALVEKMGLKEHNFDAVVGDVTITSQRSDWADFTIPYTESGVAMVVAIQPDERKNAWIFLKPLTSGLWLTTGAFFVFTGFVVWVLEHRINEEFRGPPMQQVGMIFYFSFSTLVFAHKEKVRSNLTRFVVIVWVFVVLVLTSSYTANLTSMLTVEQLKSKINNINDLIKNGECVGYQEGSFVRNFLIHSFDYPESKLISYSTLAQFDEALSNGSRNGGVSAIFDELPYIRLLLSNPKYYNKYTMIGLIYPTSGLGFAFPKGSPLVSEVSRGIVKLKTTKKMESITEKWLGKDSNGTDFTSRSLDLDSFWGLFYIAGLSSSLALAIFLSSFIYENRHVLTSTASMKEKLLGLAKLFSREKDESLSSKESRVLSHGVGVSAASPAISIPCDQDKVFSTVEISPIQPALPPQVAN